MMKFTKEITNISKSSKYLLTPTSINDNGIVVGEINDKYGFGYLWIPKIGIQYLDFFPKAINNQGIIFGTTSEGQAVIWKNGQMIDAEQEIGLNSNFSTTKSRIVIGLPNSATTASSHSLTQIIKTALR